MDELIIVLQSIFVVDQGITYDELNPWHQVRHVTNNLHENNIEPRKRREKRRSREGVGVERRREKRRRRRIRDKEI